MSQDNGGRINNKAEALLESYRSYGGNWVMEARKAHKPMRGSRMRIKIISG